MALVTAAELRAANLPNVTGTAEDTRLGILIDEAEAAIARWLGFPRADSGVFTLEDVTYTFYLSGPRRRNERELVLPIRPVQSITTIYQDSDETYTTLVASSDYFTDQLADGIVMLKQSPACGAWLDGDRPIKATVVAGWATAPKSLRLAIAYQVQYEMGQGRTAGAHSVSAGGKSATAGYTGAGSAAILGIDPRAAGLLHADRLWERFVG